MIYILEKSCYNIKGGNAMTINEFIKENDFPEMKVLGEMNYYKYYIEKYPLIGQDVGIPFIIVENKKKNTFEICDAHASLSAMALFL